MAAAIVVSAGLLCLVTSSPSAWAAAPPEQAGASSVAPVVPDPETETMDAARSKIQSGDISAAAGILAAYVDAHPAAADPAMLLGDLDVRAGKRAEAERVYLAMLRANPNLHEVHDRLGTLYVSMQRTRDALQQFDLAVPFSRAYEHLVALHRHIGDLLAFEEDARNAVSADAFDSGALWALGLIYQAENRPRDAIPMLKRAADISRESCAVLSRLGDAYLAVYDYEHASNAFQRCLAIDPTDYSTLVELSSVDLDRGGHESEALALLRKAQSEAPYRAEAYVNFGFIEDKADRWQNAADLYLKAIALDPLQRDAYVDLGYEYLSHGAYGLAEKALMDGLGAAPDDGRLHYFLGLTYLRQGKIDLARTEFKAAMHGEEPEVARAAAASLAST